MAATSPALPAAPIAWSRDSLVGGGTAMFSCEGFWASGTGWSWRVLEDWIADVMGFMCFEEC